MSSIAPICFLCKKTEEDTPGLKEFKSGNWDTLKAAARRRRILKNDKFLSTTDLINTIEGAANKYYHSRCLSGFCAIKRLSSPSNDLTESANKTTRSNSDLPSTNKKGVLRKECLFCGKTRKRKSQKNEALHKCLSRDGSKSIIIAATSKCDARIIALGEDLIAKEAMYHNSCRRYYVRDDGIEDEQMSSRKIHEEAFRKLSMFIENEVIKNKTPMLATMIANLYEEEFLAAGGTQEDMDKYTVQHLMSKVTGRFEHINIDKQANKSGNFIFSSSLTTAEAIAILDESSTKEQAIRCAAMTLRTQILAMPPSKTPSPTSIHTIKETAPQIPHLVLLFFRTLISGLQPESVLHHSMDQIKRKTLASASDAVFNCTRGAVRPWKHQALGLGLGTLTGSKALLSILNRFGHCISYDEVKRLETEIAYTCTDGQRDTPAGLGLQNGLGTGMVNIY